MDYYNMNFRDFINPQRKQVQKVEEPIEELEEEYQEPVRKVVKRVPQPIVEEYEEPEEPDYDEDEEDEYIEEPEEEPDYYDQPVVPVRQAPRITQHRPQRPVPRPTVQRVPPRKPKPQHRPGYAMPDAEFRRPLAVSQKQLRENTIEGTANSLTEAIKRKVDTVFYRFGIQGLEKLDEKILDTIEELQYPEPKPVKKPLREMRRAPVRKPVKKYRPLPLEDVPPVPTLPEPEPVYEEPIYEEPIVEEEQIVEPEPVEEVQEVVPPPPPPKPVKASPKPSFLKPVDLPKPEPKVEESTGDDEEDLIRAAYNVDFTPEEEKHEDAVSDDEMWNTVEAILEAQPSQELVHEPQGTSSLPAPPPSIDELQETETVAEEPSTEPVTEPVETVEPVETNEKQRKQEKRKRKNK